ncbi:MAG: hypothetical protein Q9217_000026 [Psora testacea]
MPTFYALGTTIQLSTALLKNVITANPIQNKCREATKEVEDISYEFARASKDGTLAEDALEDEATGSHLRFLGANRDLPFFMVRGGEDLFDDGFHVKARRTRRAARIPPLKQTVKNVLAERGTWADLDVGAKAGTSKRDDSNGRLPLRAFCDEHHSTDLCTGARRKPEPDTVNDCDPNRTTPAIPHALCLTVFLSPASFIRSNTKKTTKAVYHDIKIDVFYNGTLTHSNIVSSRYHKDLHTMTEHIVRFTGQRFGRMLEKPWIINPPSHVSGDQDTASSPLLGSTERWTAISTALLREANRLGRNIRGARPAIGEYLESLANLPMPQDIESQCPGIIDAVVTYGQGAKLGPETPYLTRPTLIDLLGFEQYAEPDSEQLGPSLSKIDAKMRGSSVHPAGTSRDSPVVMEATTRSSRVYRSISTLKPDVTQRTPENGPHAIPRLNSYIEHSDSPTMREAIAAFKSDHLGAESIIKRPSKMSRHSLIYSGETPKSDAVSQPSKPCSTVPTAGPRGDEDSRKQAASALVYLSTSCPLKPSVHPPHVTTRSDKTLSSTPTTNPPHATRTTRCPATPTRTSSPGHAEENSTRPSSRESSRLTSPPPEFSDSDFNPGESAVFGQRSSPSRWVKLKYTQPLSSHASSGSTDISPFKPPKAIDIDHQPITPKRTSTPTRPPRIRTPRRRGSRMPATSATAVSGHVDKDFIPGELSEGCRIGYAEPGIVRTIGSVRGGWFREAGFVMGARFIVG